MYLRLCNNGHHSNLQTIRTLDCRSGPSVKKSLSKLCPKMLTICSHIDRTISSFILSLDFFPYLWYNIYRMDKECKNCGKIFPVSQKHLIKTKVFCSLPCSQNWWMLKRNKTGKFIGESKKFGIQSRKTLHLNPEQRQLLLGSLFGDGHIGERICKTKLSYYYSEGHSIKQLDYVIHKMQKLTGFIAQKNPTPIAPNGFSPIPKICFCSVVHNDFKDLFNLFYKKINGKNIKVVSARNLQSLSPLGLLYWYLDDGDLSKKRTIGLSTYSFTEKEHLVLKRWFKKRFGIQAIVSYSTHKKLFFTRFNVADSKKFLSLILPFKQDVPANMWYKLPNFKELKTK